MSDEDTRGRMLIEREERKLERARAKLDAYQKNMEETIANLLKKENVKKALARDAMAATRDPGRRDRIFEQAGEGLFTDDDEVVTGEFEERRPWDR